MALTVFSTLSPSNSPSEATANTIATWKQNCVIVQQLLDDPYLQASFAFLSQTEDSFSLILNNDKIRCLDRVAFACRFLANNEVFLPFFNVAFCLLIFY